MIWSKLKKSFIMLCADAVKPHLQLYLTRYGPGFSHIKTRAWLTWDGAEIANFATARWMQEYCQQAGLSTNDATAYAADHEQGIYSSDDFYAALAEYVTLSIDAALSSSHSIIHGLTMFDRRVGRRRLLAMRFDEMSDPFVRGCYRLRCLAEGIMPGVAAGNEGR